MARYDFLYTTWNNYIAKKDGVEKRTVQFVGFVAFVGFYHLKFNWEYVPCNNPGPSLKILRMSNESLDINA
jgi:hypothetical protein